MWNTTSQPPGLAHSIWVHDEAAGEVWIAEVAAVGLIHCNVWPAATPSDGKCAMVPRLRWRGSLRCVEMEVEMEMEAPSWLSAPLHDVVFIHQRMKSTSSESSYLKTFRDGQHLSCPEPFGRCLHSLKEPCLRSMVILSRSNRWLGRPAHVAVQTRPGRERGLVKMRLTAQPQKESVALQRIMKIKLRLGSWKIGGSVCKINAWSDVKMDEAAISGNLSTEPDSNTSMVFVKGETWGASGWSEEEEEEVEEVEEEEEVR
ncbi:unnamed protein product [Pleuronectes platessa]|uniref:Uncharacterized protein n=1 Tax=Pleuronectes platessa TaxID=8262 RepID=A0A9N7YK54_PLEPL|nr:unnamed protein product [Pleuronectes platessa]